MKVKTFSMQVFYTDNTMVFHKKLSRVAVKRFREYYVDTLFVDRIIVKENEQ